MYLPSEQPFQIHNRYHLCFPEFVRRCCRQIFFPHFTDTAATGYIFFVALAVYRWKHFALAAVTFAKETIFVSATMAVAESPIDKARKSLITFSFCGKRPSWEESLHFVDRWNLSTSFFHFPPISSHCLNFALNVYRPIARQSINPWTFFRYSQRNLAFFINFN